MKVEALLRTAVNLRAATPDGWTNFITELQAYNREMADELVRASPDQLATVQGRAQGVNSLVVLLATAHVTYEQMERKKHEHRRNQL